MKDVRIFVCPADCDACQETAKTCVLYGMMRKDEASTKEKVVAKIHTSMMAKVEERLIKEVSPEIILKAFAPSIKKLAQAIDIIIDAGEEMSQAQIEKNILSLIPSYSFADENAEIRAKFAVVATVIALKLMETIRGECHRQGPECCKCYFQEACLQRLDEVK